MQRGDAQRAGERCRHLAPHPGATGAHRRAPLLHASGHVVQHRQQHVPVRGGEAFQGPRGRGREQRVEAALAGQERLGVGDQQAAARPGAAARGPVALELDQQVRAPERRVRVVGHFQRHEPATVQQPLLGAVEINVAADDGALVPGRAVHDREGAHVGLVGLVHRGRRGQGRAALPALDDARVARVGHRARPEVGGDEHGVGVFPVDRRLGLGQLEAAGRCRHEPLRAQVELAQHLGVGAAARQRHDAALVARAQAGGAAPDPALLLGLAQRVQVEHRFPRRLRLAVVVQRGAAPQAARVGRVLPQVVDMRADAADGRDAVARVEDLQDARAHGFEAGVLLEHRAGLAIALAHPGQRALALHLFQPQVRVVVGGRRGLGGGEGGCGHQGQGDQSLHHHGVNGVRAGAPGSIPRWCRRRCTTRCRPARSPAAASSAAPARPGPGSARQAAATP